MHLKKKQSRCRTAASKKNVSNSLTVISQKFLPLYFSSEALKSGNTEIVLKNTFINEKGK